MDFREASLLFDLYIDWERRLAKEMPFLLTRLGGTGAKRVADVACGAGFHAASLAKAGFSVTGIDPDPDLLRRAEARAEEEGVPLRLERAAFADLPGPWKGAFDAALCLGNSVALVPPGGALKAALSGLCGLVKPGGGLIVHTVNFPMLARRPADPFGPVRKLVDGSLLIKGFLPREGDSWDVLFLRLTKKPAGGWIPEPVRFQVHPHGSAEMESAGKAAGLCLDALRGGFNNEPPDAPDSGDLVYEFTRLPGSPGGS